MLPNFLVGGSKARVRLLLVVILRVVFIEIVLTVA